MFENRNGNGILTVVVITIVELYRRGNWRRAGSIAARR
jgi:hypothetical protein